MQEIILCTKEILVNSINPDEILFNVFEIYLTGFT